MGKSRVAEGTPTGGSTWGEKRSQEALTHRVPERLKDDNP